MISIFLIRISLSSGESLHSALAAHPVSRCHAPAAAVADPSVWRPVIAWATGAPIAAHPNMAAAVPIPVTGEPDVTWGWSYSSHLHAGHGRRDRHYAAAVISRRRGDNTAAQQGGGQ